ncbi:MULTISPECIES: DUF4222 domain-containing protein [Serratia]|uniref:DUF4222 domain-containing protein n=1 Tax=Serratia TaxID=613 RepID=UPI0014199433|nr:MULTISPECIES: DUF4222 domain-containing protein [Serratia]NIC29330.1 DUF4222 domain-containing protein [Serratia plymuthica]UNK26243.1 DUF4222 domain-containing protein [Serratia plymuthica]
MTSLLIQAGQHYRDRNHVVVLVHEIDQARETVSYSQVGYEWTITTALIVFRSRFIRFDV